MIQNFISMNGYGFFVWLSFAITFLACGMLYYKTYKTLKKYEKDFAKELDQLSEAERKLVLEKSKVASQFLASYNKSI
ncbi:MAG: heme exporter protein CcmD [Flavobacteriaceae bacterium TMED206]|jgi:heme exporter protein CcmD|nr:MAG: heme exporter protein CcmD [Flavobacteriaceae bacterium TMED206]|tara:strand:- start:9 stop:242 length:234 start_codon:yes stop_codon:yes gene_type:complete